MAKAHKNADADQNTASAEFWLSEIDAAEKSFKEWFERGKKVVDRYRDDRGARDAGRRKFNILWSNVQVLKPALYGRMPKPEVSRRYQDQDQVGRVASLIQERCLEYEVEEYPDFNQAMIGSVEDRLLPGRGVAWVRYEMDEETGYECAPCDYVNWQDFLHNPARTWDEVWWVAKRAHMSRSEGIERFGDIFKLVPVENKKDVTGDKETPKDALKAKAQVWEIWDKSEKKVIWIAKGFAQVLDEKPDPLQLEKFFPCPKPLYATTTTGSLIPVPDYTEYQDQAEELDLYTQRIAMLTKALRVRGVYNAEYKSVKRLLTETEENELIPVDSWAAFAEKGGLKGAVDWLPLDIVAAVLERLYKGRQECLNIIYQTIGLSDIMRGSSDSSETATAQQIKANFGSMRLRSTQADVAMFATELLRLKAEIQCRFYSPETMLKMAGIEFTADGQNQQLVMQAIQLLKERRLKDFRISIESDTLAQLDERAEKEEMVEFIGSMGTILKEALPVIQAAPTMLPFIGEVMKLACRKQRAGRAVEMVLEQALQATQQQLSQPKPDPQAQAEEAKAKAVQQKAQLDVQVAQQKAGIEQQQMMAEHQMDQAKLAVEGQRVQLKVAAAHAMPQRGNGTSGR